LYPVFISNDSISFYEVTYAKTLGELEFFKQSQLQTALNTHYFS